MSLRATVKVETCYWQLVSPPSDLTFSSSLQLNNPTAGKVLKVRVKSFQPDILHKSRTNEKCIINAFSTASSEESFFKGSITSLLLYYSFHLISFYTVPDVGHKLGFDLSTFSQRHHVLLTCPYTFPSQLSDIIFPAGSGFAHWSLSD